MSIRLDAGSDEPAIRIACDFPDPEDSRMWASELSEALPLAEVHAWTRGDLLADYAVVWKPSQEFFDSQGHLKAIFNAGAGADALSTLRLDPAVPVVRLEDAGMAEQMSEYVTYAVLRHFREFDIYEAQAAARVWIERPPKQKSDFPVGILGFGVLGSHVARTLQNLGFHVSAWTRSGRNSAPVPVFHGEDGLRALLATARILVCLLPLTEETKGLICRKTMSYLPKGTYLINVARGQHVVESDLFEALNDGTLCGATLDVCSREPLPPLHPLWTHPRITLTPHIAASTLRKEAIAQIAAKIKAFERGLPLLGTVSPQLGY